MEEIGLNNSNNKIPLLVAIAGVVAVVLYVVSSLSDNDSVSSSNTSTYQTETWSLQEGEIDDPGWSVDTDYSEIRSGQTVYSLSDIKADIDNMKPFVLDSLMEKTSAIDSARFNLEYVGSQISGSNDSSDRNDLYIVYLLKYTFDDSTLGYKTEADSDPNYVIAKFTDCRLTSDGRFEYTDFSFVGTNASCSFWSERIIIDTYLVMTTFNNSIYDVLPSNYYDTDLEE